MLSDNIRTIRKAKGLSQQALADRLHVVRQTVSKWEQGQSVPDADLLVALSDALETPVDLLLGERAAAADPVCLAAAPAAPEACDMCFARRARMRRRVLAGLLCAVCVVVAAAFAVFLLCGEHFAVRPDSSMEAAVAGVIFHAAEWLFVRIAPFALTGAAAGLWLIIQKSRRAGSV